MVQARPLTAAPPFLRRWVHSDWVRFSPILHRMSERRSLAYENAKSIAVSVIHEDAENRTAVRQEHLVTEPNGSIFAGQIRSNNKTSEICNVLSTTTRVISSAFRIWLRPSRFYAERRAPSILQKEVCQRYHMSRCSLKKHLPRHSCEALRGRRNIIRHVMGTISHLPQRG